ncbi:S41 family peptidase [bacterium]|nr:MAG: S41 family peptidase [bacterium]
MKISKTFIFVLFSVVTFNQCTAQDPASKISASDKRVVINTIVSLLKENYVFEEKADAVEKELNMKFTTNQYDRHETINSFGDQLNMDLSNILNDKHVQIYFSPKIVRRLRNESKGNKDQAPDEPFVAMLKNENFRMRKVEILHGNIGYFKIDNFVELKYCKETLTGAMNFISNSSAIVLDLSDCGGGPSETMDFILSYFLPESTKIGELKFRKNNEVKEYYTVKDPSIKKLTDMPLYILVSNNTASAAEGLAACLQEYKRAVVIGGQTKGLGNPGELFVINDVLYMFITTAVSGTAISGKNFNGIGVTPDINAAAPGSFNFNKAMTDVCQSLSKKAKEKKLKNASKWLLFEYESLAYPDIADNGYLQSILGTYQDGAKILSENGSIYYFNGSSKRKLTYMSKSTFSVEGRKDYRVFFPKDFNEMKILWFDDTEDVIKRID